MDDTTTDTVDLSVSLKNGVELIVTVARSTVRGFMDDVTDKEWIEIRDGEEPHTLIRCSEIVSVSPYSEDLQS